MLLDLLIFAAPLNFSDHLAPRPQLSSLASPLIAEAEVGLPSPAAVATVLTVTSTADGVDANDEVLTLREAIAMANSNADVNRIIFDLPVLPYEPAWMPTTIQLSSQLELRHEVTIDGSNANLVISGGEKSRVFAIAPGATVKLNRLTLAQGQAAHGGGILNDGTLTLTDSTVQNSKAQQLGGGIFNRGRLNLVNSTVAGNISRFGGGGIANHGSLSLVNSTLSGNTAYLLGGGIDNSSGNLVAKSSTIAFNTADSQETGVGNGGGIYVGTSRVELQNTIVARNVDRSGDRETGAIHANISGPVVDGGANLIGDYTGSSGFSRSHLVGTATSPIDPRLGPLQDNGGLTWTHGLLVNSVARGSGDVASASALDQRGMARGETADIGAYEVAFSAITVDTLVDEDNRNFAAGNVSLREALRYIDDGGTVTFAPGLSGTIALQLGQLEINKTLTVQGPGADQLIINGRSNRSRGLDIAPSGVADLSGLTIAGGNSYFSSDGDMGGGGLRNRGRLRLSHSVVRNNQGRFGGGIANGNGATLELINSTLEHNSADETGGGIHNRGTLTIRSSTLYSNNGGLLGGALINIGTTTIANSTFSSNSATTGQIDNFNILDLRASTIFTDSQKPGWTIVGLYSPVSAGNNAITTVKHTIITEHRGGSVWGRVISLGHNLIATAAPDGSSGFMPGVRGDRIGTPQQPLDPQILPLADNGGPTWTHALRPGSPAIAMADPGDRTLTTDQRDVPRSPLADIGAYEHLNLAPIARNDTLTLTGRRLMFSPLDNDADPEGDRLELVNFSRPQHGLLVRSSQSTFTYTATGLGLSSSDRFTYTVRDAKGNTSTATVQINGLR
ncbi:choice-of-anchor Q domain-containing protein [Leptolyngbya sp. CCNP1308]|uniref:choice-of-anchor Q domain-containing protein n=1 Tax=Leptolyngbya sp. CCNP1308 TaxID=3110255 RepID=UPI002B20233E|nr:choice-of-anchor Q domain-containing protein [Leptolyngbya sp. CCNP1308]MEA5449217.1 choice-of-anchor Q domain-containing protein [Leptolyngbya sp. CCNP1308]